MRSCCRVVMWLRVCSVAGLVVWSGWSGVAQAQQWQGDFNVAVPVTELAEMYAPGPSVALSANWPLGGAVGMRVRGEAGLLRGDRIDAYPFHLVAGPVWTFRAPHGEGWGISADASIGGSYLRTSRGMAWIPGYGPSRELQLGSSFSAGMGLHATRSVGEGLVVVLHGGFLRMFTSGDETMDIEGNVHDGFGHLTLVPLGVGLRWLR